VFVFDLASKIPLKNIAPSGEQGKLYSPPIFNYPAFVFKNIAERDRREHSKNLAKFYARF